MAYPTYDIKPAATDLDYLARLIHENAKAKGFWDENWNFAEKLALIHSEVSEALEEHRAGRPLIHQAVTEDGPGKPEGILSELADVLIRTLDLMSKLTEAEQYSINKIVETKMAYNSTREHKHGKAY